MRDALCSLFFLSKVFRIEEVTISSMINVKHTQNIKGLYFLPFACGFALFLEKKKSQMYIFPYQVSLFMYKLRFYNHMFRKTHRHIPTPLFRYSVKCWFVTLFFTCSNEKHVEKLMFYSSSKPSFILSNTLVRSSFPLGLKHLNIFVNFYFFLRSLYCQFLS